MVKKHNTRCFFVTSQLFLLMIVPFFLVFFSTDVRAYNIYKVENSIMARAYVDTLKKWEPREFSVWVGINDSKETLVFLRETLDTETLQFILSMMNKYKKDLKHQ